MMLNKTFIEREDYVGARNYNPIPVVISHGKGVWLWDVEGNRYLDMLSAYSAISHGHGHPRILKALTEQASRLAVCSRAVHHDKMADFLETLCRLVDMDRALLMNSGAEAVETAVKAARRYGYQIKGIPENKAEIIVMEGNFHGRTTGIISFSSDESYKKNFGPFLPGFKIIPYGNIGALKAAITANTCAVLTEPIQGEAGVLMPPQGWLKEVEAACRANDVLLMVDEIQSGLGRSGRMLACDHEDVKPDVVMLGKALGGGFLPISAVVGREGVMGVFNPGSHGSTFGGNPLAAAVGKAALDTLIDEKLVEQSDELGKYLIDKLCGLNSPYVTAIRGKGLWIGIDIDPNKAVARDLCMKLLAEGLIVRDTHKVTMRLAPPLVITKGEIDWAFERIARVLTV
ncbi:MAG: ornithine--oxo-acid transaminase [Candidatus Paracaedibacteraceae bacterium]|nr:ornithine--oxo-acid transaminase [Candidatus Paracaedibacteraceae bacterium]